MRFEYIYNDLADDLLYYGTNVDVGEWHAQDVRGVPQLVTRENTNVQFSYRIPSSITKLQDDVQPNMPFAEAQFADRVSGEPLNPPPSADLWPWKSQSEVSFEKFSHTYPERFWPKQAGTPGEGSLYNEDHHEGIRYAYGDLQDVVDLLAHSPYTRQAYLPVWFPEDTGNVENVRIPCSLGYHFLFRDGELNITYFIRSVDFVRHFRDDVYMAARLCQWMLNEIVSYKMGNHHMWEQIEPGYLNMHIVSLHCMQGDLQMMRKELYGKGK